MLAIKRGFYPVAFNVVFVFRRILVVWILLVFGYRPYVQVTLHIAITLGKLGYLRVVRPFTAKSD